MYQIEDFDRDVCSSFDNKNLFAAINVNCVIIPKKFLVVVHYYCMSMLKPYWFITQM